MLRFRMDKKDNEFFFPSRGTERFWSTQEVACFSNRRRSCLLMYYLTMQATAKSIMKNCWNYSKRNSEVLEEKTCPSTTAPTTNSRWTGLDRTQVYFVRSWRLTAWAMADLWHYACNPWTLRYLTTDSTFSTQLLRYVTHMVNIVLLDLFIVCGHTHTLSFV
jgi:hypothetical protein